MKQLAINIKVMRKKRKITQAFLANKCNVTGAAVSQWESKTNPSSPDLENLLVMAKLFKMPIEALAQSKNIDSFSIEKTEMSMPLFREAFNIIALSDQPENFNTAGPVIQTLVFSALCGLLHNADSREIAADKVMMKALGLVKNLQPADGSNDDNEEDN